MIKTDRMFLKGNESNIIENTELIFLNYLNRIYACEEGILICCYCIGKDKCSHYRLKAVEY